MASWLHIPTNSDFSFQNLPYGIFSIQNQPDHHIGIAIGDYVLDLNILTQENVFDDLGFDTSTLKKSTLNLYASLGRSVHRLVRNRVQEILEKDTDLGALLKDNQDRRSRCLIKQEDVQLHLPFQIGDYTDFFCGLHHALNGAEIVKHGSSVEQLCPCFYNLPVAYHGRASSVVVSGTPFRRPRGQFPVDGKVHSGPTRRLDFEVEFAAFIANGNDLGTSISVDQAEDHIFGFVLLNDWSARDIQMYEAPIMGPFGGKNFCTTISPWVVTPEALNSYKTATKLAKRELPEYLREEKDSAFNLCIQVDLDCKSGSYTVAKCNTNNVIFSFSQMIAHHTRVGCPLRTGDLIGTGTLSGATDEELGCLLEITKGGKKTRTWTSESGMLERLWLEDGDTIEFTARASDGIGFGSCSGKILPAI